MESYFVFITTNSLSGTLTLTGAGHRDLEIFDLSSSTLAHINGFNVVSKNY